MPQHNESQAPAVCKTAKPKSLKCGKWTAERSFAVLLQQHFPSALVWNSKWGIVDTQIHFDQRLDSVFHCPDASGTLQPQSSGTLAWAKVDQYCLKIKDGSHWRACWPGGASHMLHSGSVKHCWLSSTAEGWSACLLPHHILCGLEVSFMFFWKFFNLVDIRLLSRVTDYCVFLLRD